MSFLAVKTSEYIFNSSHTYWPNNWEKMQVPVELKIKYLDRRIQDIQKIMASLDQNDFSLAMKLGHQVKGNAVTFDLPQMANLGVEIESAARNRDKDSVRTLAQKMEQAISVAQSEIR